MRKRKVREADKFVEGYKARDSLVALTVKNLPVMQGTQVRSLGRSPGEGDDYLLQYSCLENPMDRGA